MTDTARELTPQERKRYVRQLLLSRVGEKGQLALLQAEVTLGGSTSDDIAACYLERAGCRVSRRADDSTSQTDEDVLSDVIAKLIAASEFVAAVVDRKR